MFKFILSLGSISWAVAGQSCLAAPGLVKDQNDTYFVPLMGESSCDLTVRSPLTGLKQVAVTLDFGDLPILANLIECPVGNDQTVKTNCT
jgi:hypothetical protein